MKSIGGNMKTIENINKKPKRAAKFQEYEDSLSEHDMDFDWADETMHAHYGSVWLTKLLEVRGEENDPKIVRQRCHDLALSAEPATRASGWHKHEFLGCTIDSRGARCVEPPQ